MTEIQATEFVRNFSRYREIAQREPVAVRAHDRITGYFVSAIEFEQLQALKARQATAVDVEELDSQTLADIQNSRMDSRHLSLNALLD
jgi:predicted nucleotidyltransferase